MTLPETISLAEPIYFTTTREVNALWYGNLEIKKDDYIKTLQHLEFDNEIWIVRKIRKKMIEGVTTFVCTIEHNMSELNYKTIPPFDITTTPQALLTSWLAGTGWTIGTISGVTGSQRVKSKKRISILKALWLMAAAWDGEFDFHSMDKKIDFKDKIGNQTKKQPIRYDKQSDYMVREEDATELITRLYIYGAEDITIKSVNPTGEEYIDSPNIGLYDAPIEDTIYTTIADPALLLAYGQAYLALNDDEIYRYDINIADMTVFRIWATEGVNLGDCARVQNTDLNLNLDIRVKKIIKDYMDPNQYIIELDNVHDNLARRLAAWYDALTEIAPYVDEPGYVDGGNVIESYEQPGEEEIPVKEIGIIAEDLTGSIVNPMVRKMVLDSSGNIYVAYNTTDGVSNQIYVARSTNDGGGWVSTKISTLPNFTCGDAGLAIDSNDNIYAVWTVTEDGVLHNHVQFSKFSGGSWSTPVDLPFSSSYMSFSTIAIDSADRIHIVAMNYYGGGSLRYIKSTDGGANWSAYSTIYSGYTMYLLSAIALEVSRDSDILHLGFTVVTGGMTRILYLNSIDYGDHWGNLTNLSDITKNADHICFATNSIGSLHFVWCEHTNPAQIDLYYNNCVGGVWGTKVILNDGSLNVKSGNISVDDGDHIYVTWIETTANPTPYVAQVCLRVFQADVWHSIVVRTANPNNKSWITMIHAQFPLILDKRPCILNDGFAAMWEELDAVTPGNKTLKFWIDYKW